MSRPGLGIGLIVAGLCVVGVGVWLKRAFEMRTLMIVMHTCATVGFLIPGLMVLVWRSNPEEQGDDAGKPPGSRGAAS